MCYFFGGGDVGGGAESFMTYPTDTTLSHFGDASSFMSRPSSTKARNSYVSLCASWRFPGWMDGWMVGWMVGWMDGKEKE